MKLLMIVGSFRQGSFNRQLAEEAIKQLENQADCSILDYSTVPFFNQDTEFPTPAAVVDVRKQCEAADGIWFFTPEYNGEIPGGEKNLLDWLSRTTAPGLPRTATAVYGKPAAVSGIGGMNKTKGSRQTLDRLLPFMGMKLMKEPQTGLSIPPAAWKTSVLELTEEQKAEIKAEGEAFLAFIRENLKDTQI